MTANLPDNPFANLTLAEYGARLRRGVTSAEGVTATFLQRIDALNPKLGAFIFVARKQALKRGGAIILGKTWTSEFALGGINFIQRVPWNPCDA